MASEYNSARGVAVYDAALSSTLTMFTPGLASRRIIQRFNYGRGPGGVAVYTSQPPIYTCR